MADFIDRKVLNPNRFHLTKIGGNWDIIGDDATVELVRDPGEIGEEGTLLTASLFETLFDKKQQALILSDGSGLSFETTLAGKVEVKLNSDDPDIKNMLKLDYSNIAPKLNSDNMTVDHAKWEAKPITSNDTDYEIDTFYCGQLGDERYKSARVDMEISNMSFKAGKGEYPSVIVKFENGDKDPEFCIFDISNGKVRIAKTIEVSTEDNLPCAYFNVPDLNNFTVRVIRGGSGSSYGYSFYVNENYVDTLSSERATTDADTIKIGVANCNAVIKYWKIDGEF